MTDPNTTAATGDPKAAEATPPADSEKGDQPLGESGKRALEAERTARQQAESDLKGLRGEFDEFKKSLSDALGIQSTKGEGADAVQQVQAQLAAMQHESMVYRLAAQHQITNEGDLELLQAATAEQAPKLAERLAAKAEAETKPGTPKPDATQGGAAGEPPALNSNALEQALKAKLGIS